MPRVVILRWRPPAPYTAITGWLLSLQTVILLLLVAGVPLAHADTYFMSLDEWGKGYVCDGNPGAAPAAATCGSVGGNMGIFTRLPSAFSADPGPGGGASVLTYTLPAALSFGPGELDITMSDMFFGDNDIDVVRLEGDKVYFYSTQNPKLKHADPLQGPVVCSVAPIVGCDGIADTLNIPTPIDNVRISDAGGAGLDILGGGGGTVIELELVSEEASLQGCLARLPLAAASLCTAADTAPPPD